MDNTIINDPVLDDLIGKREDETPQAYSAFVFFGRLPEHERHSSDAEIRTAAHVATSVDEIRHWRRSNDWDNRASLVDAYGYKLSFSHTLDLLKEDDRLFVKHNRDYKEKILKARQMLLDNLIDQIGNAKSFNWKPSDLAAVYNALTKSDKNLGINPTSMMDTLAAQRANLKEMSDEDFQKMITETERQEKLLLVQGGENN